MDNQKNSLAEEIRLATLKNAVQFNGKANPKAVLGNILAKYPKEKQHAGEIMQQVNVAVEQINKQSLEEQRAILEEQAPELLVKKKGEKHTLVELPNAVEGEMVTRIPPEPSKCAHIGHALSFLINYLYAKKYKGKCIVRFEDTNPLLVSQEYVDSITEDLKWLGIDTPAFFVSDDMEKLYAHAEHLIQKGLAFVCLCDREQMQELRKKGVGCVHRDLPPGEQMIQWKTMLDGEYKEGEAILRLRGDIDAENMVMRDPVLFRISYAEHFRQKDKYVVWPLYDFENAVEDGEHKVTHILRSSEFGGMRVELQNRLKELLMLPKQEVIQYGRFNVVDAITQGREVRELITTGEITGWDDPRLVTLSALRRRGIQPEALHILAIEVGLSSTPTTLDWMRIASANRKLIDATAPRYFFVKEPVTLTIENTPSNRVKRKLHPDWEDKTLTYEHDNKFILEEKDKDAIEQGEFIRLMDCINVKDKQYHSNGIAMFKEQEGKKIIQWLLPDAVDVEILMPDASWQRGKAEPTITELKLGTVIQFIRFGFCRYEGEKKFVFAHE